jgi:hypothetical protein
VSFNPYKELKMTDDELVADVRNAASALRSALSRASAKGLLFEVEFKPLGITFVGKTLTGQFDWHQSISARRETIL